jgi:hypothetical protein
VHAAAGIRCMLQPNQQLVVGEGRGCCSLVVMVVDWWKAARWEWMHDHLQRDVEEACWVASSCGHVRACVNMCVHPLLIAGGGLLVLAEGAEGVKQG